MQMAVKLGFYLGLRSMFNSVAVSNHTLRPVKFCRGEKLFFPAVEGLTHFVTNQAERGRGKRKNWCRKQPQPGYCFGSALL